MEGGSLKRFEIEPVLLDTYIYIHICVCVFVWQNGRNRGVLHEQGRVVREKKVEEKAESHCFSRSWQSVCRSTPLERSHLPLPTPSGLIVQLLHVSLSLSLSLSSSAWTSQPTLESTLQAAAESPPAHAPSKRRQLVSH